eukprot:9770641-Alexandrium_andersonii.AAC.1
MLEHSRQTTLVAIKEVVQEARSRPELLQTSKAMHAEHGIGGGRGPVVFLGSMGSQRTKSRKLSAAVHADEHPF